MEEGVLYQRAFYCCLSLSFGSVHSPRCGPRLQARVYVANSSGLSTSSRVYRFYCLGCRDNYLHCSKIIAGAIFQQKKTKSKLVQQMINRD